MQLLLIGPRASGKTTIGRLVAAAMRCPFVDLDDEVLAAFSEDTVEAVWQRHGEAAWRRGEVEALEAVLDGPDRVVALGGGTPIIAEARRLIDAAREAGTARVCYLQTAAEVLAARLEADPGDRPSLRGQSVAEEIGAVLAEREHVYLAIADAVIPAHDKKNAVVRAIIEGCD